MAHSQTPPGPRWSGSTQIGFSQTTGSTSYTSITVEQDFGFASPRWENTGRMIGGYSRIRYKSPAYDATGTVTGSTTRVALMRRYIAAVGTRALVTRRSYLLVRAEHERDDNQAIEQRIIYAAGAGTNVMKTPKQTLKLELAAGRIHERDLHAEAQRYPAAAALADYALTVGERGGRIAANVERLTNLHDLDDSIVRAALTLTAPLTAKIGLNVAYGFTHDTRPNQGIFDADADDDIVSVPSKRNTSLSTALSVRW